jgi:hypothetical protein
MFSQHVPQHIAADLVVFTKNIFRKDAHATPPLAL